MADIITEILSRINDYKIRGDEINVTYCPFCNGGSKSDKATFSINTSKGTYNCLRGKCGEKGNLNRLADHLGINTKPYTRQEYFRELKPVEKNYIKPVINPDDLTDEIIRYFKLRGISESTLIKNKITSKNGNIAFNYFENGELVFVKYKIPRKPKKDENKSWRETGTKPILYGVDDCNVKYPLIIVEGEPDKLVLDECGIKNAVSIPSGTLDFSWLNHSWDFLEKFKEIIIWVDNDKAGIAFQQDIIVKLEDWKIKVVKCEDKDANVVLHKHGKEKVIDYINSATLITKQYIVDLGNVKRKDYKAQKAISTGFKQLDQLIGGFYGGQLVIWTGYTGSGKSTILSNIIISGIIENKTFAYSGELSKQDFKEWMDLQLSGRKNLSSYECPIKKQSISIPNPKFFKELDAIYTDKMFLFDSEDYATDKEVLKAMEYMAKRENVKVFLVDNLMTTPLTDSGDSNDKQSKYINKLKKFARKFDAIVHLVAHPRKPTLGQKRVDKYSVSGTADITNLADRVIGVHRMSNYDKAENSDYMDYSTLLVVFKDRKFGVFDEEIKFKFDYFSKRFYTDEEELNKVYIGEKNVDKEDWVQQCMSSD